MQKLFNHREISILLHKNTCGSPWGGYHKTRRDKRQTLNETAVLGTRYTISCTPKGSVIDESGRVSLCGSCWVSLCHPPSSSMLCRYGESCRRRTFHSMSMSSSVTRVILRVFRVRFTLQDEKNSKTLFFFRFRLRNVRCWYTQCGSDENCEQCHIIHATHGRRILRVSSDG